MLQGRAPEAFQRAMCRLRHPQEMIDVRPRNPSRSPEVPLPEFTAERLEFPIFAGYDPRILLQFIRMASRLVPVLAATSAQDSALPYRSITASRTQVELPARILSASSAASVDEKGVSEEDS